MPKAVISLTFSQMYARGTGKPASLLSRRDLGNIQWGYDGGDAHPNACDGIRLCLHVLYR